MNLKYPKTLLAVTIFSPSLCMPVVMRYDYSFNMGQMFGCRNSRKMNIQLVTNYTIYFIKTKLFIAL